MGKHSADCLRRYADSICQGKTPGNWDRFVAIDTLQGLADALDALLPASKKKAKASLDIAHKSDLAPVRKKKLKKAI